jgi:hypothetical protein
MPKPTRSITSQKMGLLLWLLFTVNLLYSAWSYALTDPNLIITTWQPYWQWQERMWQWFFHQPKWLTYSYAGIVSGLFAIYALGLVATKQVAQKVNRKTLLRFVLALSPLLLAYNALSHDVFNYMFNAKMVLVYQANPHVQTALDFARDDWLRFMHNTHTPAPYGYGWTLLSLVPSWLGFGKFISTWLAFKAWAVLSLVLLYSVLAKLVMKLTAKPISLHAFWLLFANPLLYLEVIANQHNDLWMMVPALAAFLLVVSKPVKVMRTLLLSTILLVFSISIKMATVVLIPVCLLAIGRWYWPLLEKKITGADLALIGSLGLFLPLVTERSQQFLPWYLIWSLVWLPLINNAWWKRWLVVLSVSALARYLPWLLAGGFDSLVLWQEKLIVWGGGIGLWLLSGLPWPRLGKMRYNNQA